MSAFHLAEAPIFARVHQLVREHNEQQSKLHYHVRNGVKNSLLTIVNEYIKAFRNASHMGLVADSDQLPSLRTNRAALSALTGSGERTIFDHIEVLLEADFLDKQIHGWKRNFELWINPWILFGDNYPKPKVGDLAILKSTENQKVSSDLRQSSPPKSKLETSNNLLISGVDLSKTIVGEGQRCAATNPRKFKYKLEFKLETDGAAPTVNASEKLDKAPGGGADGDPCTPLCDNDNGWQRAGNGSDVTTLIPAGTAPTNDNGWQRAGNGPDVTTSVPAGTAPTQPIDPLLHKYRKTLVLSFWQLAKEKLWPDTNYQSEYTAKVLNRIWNDVFWNWEKATTRDRCDSLYMSRIQQLEKAERYIRKQKWSSVLPPTKYFSLAFHNEQVAKGEKGNFHYTTAWQKKDEAAREKLQQDNFLNRAVQSVLTEKAPRGLKGGATMTKIQLYQYWQERLHRQSTLDMVVRFNEQIASLFSVNPNLKQVINTL